LAELISATLNIDDLIVEDPYRALAGYINTAADGFDHHEWRIAFYKTVIGEKLALREDVRKARKLLAKSKRASKVWQAQLMAYIGLLRWLESPRDIASASEMPALSQGRLAETLDRKVKLRAVEDAVSTAKRVVLETDGKLDGPEQEMLDEQRKQFDRLVKSIN
jgi:hypothetical protein